MAKHRTRARVAQKGRRLSNRTKAISRARSIAAKKGWRTRRANQERRSEIARKGWRTRKRLLSARTRRAKPSTRAAVSKPTKRRTPTRRPPVRTRPPSDGGGVGGGGGFEAPERPTFPREEFETEEGYDVDETPYDDLDDFIDAFESWDGDFEEFDIESAVSYGDEE